MATEYYHDPQGDPRSLIVINREGIMRRLYTPFRVLCIQHVGSLAEGTQFYVNEVHGTIKGELYFVIFKQPFLHKHFRLLVEF